jgi:stage III sporulation protein AH
MRCSLSQLSYNQGRETIGADTDTGKTLGEAALVDGVTIVGQDGEELQVNAEAETESLQDSYFANARLSRQQARDSALSLLQEAASSEDADQSVIDSANLSIQAMADFTMKESQIENLVTAKGYKDCVAFISENCISVVVAPPEAG